MFQQFTLPSGRVRTSLLCGYFAVLAALLLTLLAPGAFAQVTHNPNPYAGAYWFVNPYFAEEVEGAAAAEPANSAIQAQMQTVETEPTAIWLTSVASVAGLQSQINTAYAEEQGSLEPIVMTIVLYDLPQRDCSALASAGELSIAGNDVVPAPGGGTQQLTGTGLQEYENDFITPIYNILAPYATYGGLRFVLIFEPDSIPNMVTNTGMSATVASCVAANAGQDYPTFSTSGVYVEGIQYALNKFHPLTNVYQYLDIAQSAWLGWTTNMSTAVTDYNTLVTGTTASYASIDGFISNTSNYVPTKEPFMTGTESVDGSEVEYSSYYSYNPYIDEEDYDAELYTQLTAAGFPSTIGFLIDTSRNGWGGPNRPTAAGTSTDLTTWINESKIDQRPFRGDWCNVENAGIGALPAVNPGAAFSPAFPQLEAYLWVKPPGESDGTYPGSVYNGTDETGGDPNCNPANVEMVSGAANNLNALTDSAPDSPPGGVFWQSYFDTLVTNSYPALPQTQTFFTLYAASNALTLTQGASVTDVLNTFVGGYTGGPINFLVSGLPSGVTANFSPSTVTAPAPSTMTLTATSTAAPGTYLVRVTGNENGPPIPTVNIMLTVVAAQTPSFTLSASPATLSIVQGGSSGTETIALTPTGGFNGGMSYSISSLPTGVTLVGSSGSPSGITYTLTASSTAATGSYTITVTGSSGSITKTASFTLTVTAKATGSFTLKPSSTTLSVTQNSSGSDSITVTDVSPFSGSVTLAATGLPSGVSVTYGTNPTTSTSVLTFAATSAATTGTYTITITGTASGVPTATTTISLTVVAAATGSFTLKPSAATLSVNQGATATDTITVTDVSPFAGSVTLSNSTLPAGVSVAYGTNPTTGSSVLTFTASSTATTGTSTITITGTASGVPTATTTISLTVAAAAATKCQVNYVITQNSSSSFGAVITILNTGTTNWTSWTMTWTFANNQTITSSYGVNLTTSGESITMTPAGSYDAAIAAGATLSGDIGFQGTWNGTTNAVPAISINGTACTMN